VNTDPGSTDHRATGSFLGFALSAYQWISSLQRARRALAWGVLCLGWVLLPINSAVSELRRGPPRLAQNRKRSAVPWTQSVKVRGLGFLDQTSERDDAKARMPASEAGSSTAALSLSSEFALQARWASSRGITLAGNWGSAQDPDGFPELKIPVLIQRGSEGKGKAADGVISGPDLVPGQKVPEGDLLWLPIEQVSDPQVDVLISSPGSPLTSRRLKMQIDVSEDLFVLRPECHEMEIKIKRASPTPLGGIFFVNCERVDDFVSVAIHTHLQGTWKGVLRGSRVLRGGRVLWRTVQVAEDLKESKLLQAFKLVNSRQVEGRYSVSIEPDRSRPSFLNPYRWWGNFEVNLLMELQSNYSFFSVEGGWSPTYFFPRIPLALRGHWDLSFAQSSITGSFALIHTVAAGAAFVGLRPFAFEAVVGVETFFTVGTRLEFGIDSSWLIRKAFIDRLTLSYRAVVPVPGVGHEFRLGLGFGF
jgi:hypothetical protein